MAKNETPDNVIELTGATAAGAHQQGRLTTFDRAARQAAIEALTEAGAHIVIHGSDKAPIHRGWLKSSAVAAIVWEHASKGNPIGIVPWSLQSVVLDLDEGGGANMVEAVNRIELAVGAKAWAICDSSKPGRAHIWFRADKPHGNKSWRCGDAAGEIRGDKGSAICWQPEALAEALPAHQHAQPASIDRLMAEAAKVNRQRGQADRRKREGRNETLNHACWLAGVNDSLVARDQAIDKARIDGLPESEIEATARSGWDAGQADRKAKGLGGELPYTLHGLTQALDGLGIGLRVNERAQRYEIMWPGRSWIELSDTRRGWLWNKLADNYIHAPEGTEPQAWRLRGVVRDDTFHAYLHDHSSDPWLDEYIEVLPAWDKQPRIGDLLGNLFEVEPTPINFWASAQLFLGVLARTYQPGCRLRESLVLIGQERAGKSALLSQIFPSKLRALCYGDALQLHAPTQKQAEALLGKALVEVADFSGIRKADIEMLKAFMTRLDDGQVRLAYRRDPVSTPRSCIIVATTNEQHPLPNDPHGNTRFVPVHIPKNTNVESYMSKHRDQLWAEAKAIITGEDGALDIWQEDGADLELIESMREANDCAGRARLPRVFYDSAKELSEAARSADESTEDMLNLLERDGRFTLNEIKERCWERRELRPPADRTITNALRNVGFNGSFEESDGRGKMRRYWHGPNYR